MVLSSWASWFYPVVSVSTHCCTWFCPDILSSVHCSCFCMIVPGSIQLAIVLSIVHVSLWLFLALSNWSEFCPLFMFLYGCSWLYPTGHSSVHCSCFSMVVPGSIQLVRVLSIVHVSVWLFLALSNWSELCPLFMFQYGCSWLYLTGQSSVHCSCFSMVVSGSI